LKDVGLIVFGAMLGWVVNHFMPLVIQNGWESYICSLTAFGARREGLEPPTARSVGWCSASTPCARVPLMLLRSDAESSQTATVLAGNGWWTDTQTDTPVGGELSGGPGSRAVPLLPCPLLTGRVAKRSALR
jgi:hypothetical protein